MNDTTRTITQWRIQYENNNPHRELAVSADRVTEVAPGRYRHEFTAAAEARIDEYRQLAMKRGSTLIGIQRRSATTTYGPWEDVWDNTRRQCANTDADIREEDVEAV